MYKLKVRYMIAVIRFIRDWYRCNYPDGSAKSISRLADMDNLICALNTELEVE